MADKSAIEWCDATWNCLRGCSMAHGSELGGCLNCYATTVACRFSGPGLPYEGLARQTRNGPRWTGEVRFVEEKLMQPLHWNRPRRIFVNSMSDCFHSAVTAEQLDQMFAMMALCPQHVFMILTKRPERMNEYFLFRKGSPPPAGSCADITPAMVFRAAMEMVKNSDAAAKGSRRMRETYTAGRYPWPLPNVMLGVSVENQETAEARIPLLLQTPAAIRFLSAEPLLAPLDLTRLRTYRGALIDCLQGDVFSPQGEIYAGAPSSLDLVIVGGESGPGARPMALEWARSLRDQCQAAGISYFFKQWGEHCPFTYTGSSSQFIGQNGEVSYCDKGQVHQWDEKGYHLSVRVGKKRAGRLLDGKEWNEFPEVTR